MDDEVRAMTVTCHFFGGPQDGMQLKVEQAGMELYFPISPDFSITLGMTNELVPEPHVNVYLRRGAILEGHAYYDYIGER